MDPCSWADPGTEHNCLLLLYFTSETERDKRADTSGDATRQSDTPDLELAEQLWGQTIKFLFHPVSYQKCSHGKDLHKHHNIIILHSPLDSEMNLRLETRSLAAIRAELAFVIPGYWLLTT